MELLSILLSSLLGLVSPTGFVTERVAETTIRKQLVAVEHLKVRIDQAPSYQILQGKADRLRIAGRGLFPSQDLRIDTLEVESDPVSVSIGQRKLAQPLQAGIRMVLKPADLNQALRSPRFNAQLQRLSLQLLRRQDAQRVQRYRILNPQITVLASGRLRLQVQVQEQGQPQTLTLTAEATPEIRQGRSLHLNQLHLWANDQPVPAPLAKALTDRITGQLDLNHLENTGITARVLALKVDPTAIEIAAFIQVRPR